MDQNAPHWRNCANFGKPAPEISRDLGGISKNDSSNKPKFLKKIGTKSGNFQTRVGIKYLRLELY